MSQTLFLCQGAQAPQPHSPARFFRPQRPRLSVGARKGDGLVCFGSSLASGFLTGKYKRAGDLAKSERGGTGKRYLTEREVRIVAALTDVVRVSGTAPATVVLAWVAARQGVCAPRVARTRIAAMPQTLNQASLKHLNAASAFQDCDQ